MEPSSLQHNSQMHYPIDHLISRMIMATQKLFKEKRCNFFVCVSTCCDIAIPGPREIMICDEDMDLNGTGLKWQ